MVSSTIIHAIDLKTYRQDNREEWGAGFRHQSFWWRGLEFHSCHFVDNLNKVLFSLFENLQIVSTTIIHAIDHKTYRQDGWVVWGAGSREPVTSMVWIQVSLLSFCWHSNTKYCFLYFEHLQLVSSTLIHAIDNTTYRQNGWVVYVAGLRLQSLLLRGFKTNSYHLCWHPIQNIVSLISNNCTWYLVPSSMLLT